MSSLLKQVLRPRRKRLNPAIRDLVAETRLAPEDFILPLFLIEGKEQNQPLSSMPGVSRWSIDLAVKECRTLASLGIRGVALFPALEEAKKSSHAEESWNPNGLLQRAISEIKSAVPQMLVFSDVAMDPYSSDGHDGLVKNGEILNDESLEILGKMALSQAKAGADFVAPSDMMDGRVGYLRDVLDQEGHSNVGILAYTAKYCSAFYGPFRDALDSAPKFGDKKTYQMDPRNRREALLELHLDLSEGADMVMVKPALAYLDILSDLKQQSTVPVAAYQVSGEYAMILAAAEKGFLNKERAFHETLHAIKRAGADIILSYYAKEFVQKLG